MSKKPGFDPFDITDDPDVVETSRSRITLDSLRERTWLPKCVGFILLLCSGSIIYLSLHFRMLLLDDFDHFKGVMDHILYSYDTSPLTNITLVESYQDCPKGFEREKIGTFKGLSPFVSSTGNTEIDLFTWRDKRICVKRFKDQPTNVGGECTLNPSKVCRPSACTLANGTCPITGFNYAKEGKMNFSQESFAESGIQRRLKDPPILDIVFSYNDLPCVAFGYSPEGRDHKDKYNEKWGCGRYGVDDMVIKLDFAMESELYDWNYLPDLPEDIKKTAQHTIVFLVARKSIIVDTEFCLSARPYMTKVYNRINVLDKWKNFLFLVVLTIELVFICSVYFIAQNIKAIQRREPSSKLTTSLFYMLIIIGMIELSISAYALYYGWVDEKKTDDLKMELEQFEGCLKGAHTKLIKEDLRQAVGITHYMHNIYLLNSGVILVKMIIISVISVCKRSISYQRL